MSSFVIQGRRTVSGTHRVPGNKNAALPMIAAAPLSTEPVTLRNVPDIADVAAMLKAADGYAAFLKRCFYRPERIEEGVRSDERH